MTSDEVEKIVKNLPEDMHSVLINASCDAIDILCKFADYMRKNFVPVSVIENIKAEIEQGYCVVNNDYDRGRNYGLYMATQIIDKYKAESEVSDNDN